MTRERAEIVAKTLRIFGAQTRIGADACGFHVKVWDKEDELPYVEAIKE